MLLLSKENNSREECHSTPSIAIEEHWSLGWRYLDGGMVVRMGSEERPSGAPL